MVHLNTAAHAAPDALFLDYVYLSGTLDPVVRRLLKMVAQRQDWMDQFADDYDSPLAIATHIDELKSDLRSAEEMITEQASEIKRLSTRTVIELLADQESKLILAKAQAADARRSLEREQSLRKIAENKLQTWNILSN